MTRRNNATLTDLAQARSDVEGALGGVQRLLANEEGWGGSEARTLLTKSELMQISVYNNQLCRMIDGIRTVEKQALTRLTKLRG